MFSDIIPSSCSTEEKQLLCDFPLWDLVSLSVKGENWQETSRLLPHRSYLSQTCLFIGHCEPSLWYTSRAGSIQGAQSSGSLCSLFLNSSWCFIAAPDLLLVIPGQSPNFLLLCFVFLWVPESHLFWLVVVWPWASNITFLFFSFFLTSLFWASVFSSVKKMGW